MPVEATEVLQVREQLIETGKRLDHRRLVAGSEGNASARLRDGSVMITSSGSFLGRLDKSSFVRIAVDDESVLEGDGKPTSELAAHLAAYRADDSIGAVVHAHPVACVALTLRGWSLEAVPLPEAAYAFGSVPTCRFALPGTEEGGGVVGEWARKRDALLLDRHGAITFGSTVEEALARMEMLAAVAETVILAGGPDRLQPLGSSDIDNIAMAAKRYGVREDSIERWAAMCPRK